MKKLHKKIILVTGACGTIGSHLIDFLLNSKEYDCKEVIGIDNDENGLFFLDQKYLSNSKVNFRFVDIRDKDAVFNILAGVNYVFHTAALKHVIISEITPEQAIQTNIIGLENIINASQYHSVEKVIFTSSDKAVNPTNVMGTSKLMGEKLITAANLKNRKSKTIFSSTRFGNVLGSNGSVVPIFHNQIKYSQFITVTDRKMTRFIMSIAEAVKLVVKSSFIAKGGEVFVIKMPAVSIYDLGISMIEELADKYNKKPKDFKVKFIGTKPGEKMYEELMSDEECRRTIELDSFFTILPAYRGFYKKIPYNYPKVKRKKITKSYNSHNEKKMSKVKIKEFLRKNNLIEVKESSSKNRYWPGDK